MYHDIYEENWRTQGEPKNGRSKQNPEENRDGLTDSLVPRTTSLQKQYHQWSQVLTKNSNLTTLQLGNVALHK
jgi:hypothetical protein